MNAARRIPRTSVPVKHAALAAAALLAGAPAAAQGLPHVPGYTAVQQSTANAVQAVCSGFVANVATYGAASDTGTPEQRLFSSCRKMVQTANAIVGSGVTANSLGLSDDDLRTAVQAIAPVQMNAQKQMTAEASRHNVVFSRLLDLRGGARGLSLTLNALELPPLASAASTATPAGRGGGASADAPLGERWGGFLNLAYNWGDVSRTSLQDGYEFKNWSLVAGVDYRVSPALALGAAASHQRTKSDYDGNLGQVKAKTTSLAAYGTYYQDSFYLDGLIGYGQVDYDTARRIDIASTTAIAPIGVVATASPEGSQWSAVVGGGVNVARGETTITPFGRLGYLRVKNKAFAESEPVAGLGLAVDARTVDSLQSALGVRVQRAVSTSFGVLVPYGSVQWNHEFRTNQSSITSKYVNDPFNVFFTIPTEDAGSDYGVLSVGLSGQFAGGVAAFVQLGAAVGLKHVSNKSVAIGVRVPF